MAIQIGDTVRAQFAINQTDLLAPVAHDFVCPADGVINAVYAAVQVAIGTGGTLTLAVGAAPTNVAGAVITLANSAAKGSVASAVPTKGSATRAVKKGDRLRITPAGFATAGAVSGFVEIATADIQSA